MKTRYVRLRVEELNPRVVPSAATVVVPPTSLVGQVAAAQVQPARFETEAAFKAYLIDQAVLQYRRCLGKAVAPTTDWLIKAQNALTALTAGSSALGYSKTNPQEIGVEDGDIVKTDGCRLYLLTSDKLVVIDVRADADHRCLSETALHGTLQAEYLEGDRLTVIAQDAGAVSVTVFDVANGTTPTELQTTALEGSYNDSRAVGGKVYVAVNNSLAVPPPRYTIVNAGAGVKYLYESESAYRAHLQEIPLNDLLPHYTTRWNDCAGPHEHHGLLALPCDVYRPRTAGECNLASLVVFDVDGRAGPTDCASLMTSPMTTLCASQDSFYLISRRFQGDVWTYIDKLRVKGETGKLELTATGRVQGRILDQCSVSENGGYFYIATTTGRGTSTSNNVFVLRECAGALVVTGCVRNLGRGEAITSVRFICDRVYFCTFKRVDPLFSVDLSDPTHPVVTGQLKLAGYNDYLQAIDCTHLVGIGQVQGQFQISLFDVGDPAHPTLLGRYIVAPQGLAWSNAESDHRAITYDAATRTLVLSVSGINNWTYYCSQLVCHVDDTGSALQWQGQITDDSPIQRGVIVNHMLYSISDTSVQVHCLSDLNTLAAQVSLTGSPCACTVRPAPGGFLVRSVLVP